MEIENNKVYEVDLNLPKNTGNSFSFTISAQELMQLQPNMHGYARKKTNSILRYLCPCFISEFKDRYFILVGSYLYRFESLQAEKTKGIPIPLESIQRIIKLDEITFEIITIRKTYMIQTYSSSECTNWINSLRERKAMAIKQEMGHISIDKSIAKMNKDAQRLFQRKLRNESDFDEIDRNNTNPLHTY